MIEGTFYYVVMNIPSEGDGALEDWDDGEPVWSDRVGPHFKDDIIVMKDRHADRCEYVSAPFIHIDYRALDDDQLNYYLYFRDCFWEGKMIRTCEGYLWILANEILMSDADPERTYSLLMELWKERRFDLFDPSLFIEFVRDYAIDHNLPQPPADVFGSDRNETLVNLISCRPPWHIDLESLSEMTMGFGIMRDESDTLCKIVDVSLRRLNDLLLKNGGLVGMFAPARLELVHDLYVSYSLLGKKKVSVDSPDLFHNDDFRLMVRNMSRYASSLLRGLRILDRPNDLLDIVIEIIQDVYDNLDDYGPDYSPMTPATLVSIVPERYIARGLHPSVRNEDQKETGRILIMIEKNRNIPMSSRKIANWWKEDSDEPKRYVQSGYVNPSYDTFDRDQLEYYLFWRTQARKGRFLETDNGYIRLFVAEIVSCSEDPSEAIRMLKDVRSTYDDPEIRRFVNTTVLEYSLVYGLPIDSTEGAYESALNGIACMCMGSMPMKEMPLDVIASISGYESEELKRLGDEGLKAINESLIRIDQERVALGILPTMELFNVQRISHSAFYTIRRDFPVPSFNSRYQTFVVKRTSQLRTYVRNTIAVVTMYLNKFSGKKVTIKMPKYHGERTVKIIENAVRKAMGLDTEKKKVELDPSALKGARDDLEAVKSMMIVESADEKETDEKEDTVIEGWGALAKALSGVQRSYLTEALNGGGRCAGIAKANNLTIAKIEDSINSLSMDAIGDAIVENQSIVEDYLEDVAGIVKGGSS